MALRLRKIATQLPVPDQLYIDGRGQSGAEGATIGLINLATEKAIARVAAGGPPDVDRAVAAAKRAFTTWRRTTRSECSTEAEVWPGAWSADHISIADPAT